MPSSSSPIVFVGSYAAKDQAGIHAFLLDEKHGALAALGTFSGILNPSYLVIHPNGRHLYAVSESSQASDGTPGKVCALSFEQNPFKMSLLNQQTSAGDWPCHLTLDNTGRWLFASNYGTGSAAVYPVLADGSLGEMSDFVQHSGSGTHKQRQEGPHTHSVTISPDNRFALIAELGIDEILTYSLDHAKGKLTLNGETHTRPGSGPRHLAFHPSGLWVYAANELANTVTLFHYGKEQGSLVEKQTIPALPAPASENTLPSTLADIHVSASGSRLYASNRGHNSLAVYDIGPDGFLTLVAIPGCGGDVPRSFALAPGAQYILVANQNSHEVCVLPLQPGAAGVGAVLTRTTINGAACVKVV